MSKWTEQDIQFLKENYKKIPTNQISQELNRSISAIRHKANKLGISEPKNKRGKHSSSWQGCGEIHKTFFNKFQAGAKRKNIEFDLSIDYAWKLFLEQKRRCAISNLELHFPKDLNDRYSGTASLDRIDSKIGYTENNVQWLHKDVNMMKYIFDQDYFIKICKYVAVHNWYNI